MSTEARRTVTLSNETGLHARPAAELVKAAGAYSSRITVNGADAKSLLGIMALGAGKGTELELVAEGDDAEEAIEGLVGLIESGFGE